MTTAAALDLAPFYCPIPPAQHPMAASFDRSTTEWVRRFGLYDDESQRMRLERVGVGRLAALTSPNGNPEATQISSDALMWLFAFDDAHCDEGHLGHRPGELSRVLTRLLRILEAPETMPSPDSSCFAYEAAFRDLRLRLGEVASPVQIERWTDAMRMYFLCQVWEAANRVEAITPDLEDYALLRIHNGAMKVSVMLLDIADGYEVSPMDLDRPDVRALTEATCLLVGWDNDILSYHKEHIRDGDHQNLLDVLANATDKPVQSMVPEAMFLRDRIMVLFNELSTQVYATASAELHRYVTSLGHWIRANVEWATTSERYLNPDNPARLPNTWATAPTRGSDTPIDVPAVAWWWQQLNP
ncbi:terpene synthase [Streptomyces sp. NPDC048295]|uniref:terpene synthase family protein n=1 Tax=Streptomyces sp. NPDC048295 TaxID=3154617 RepID=UPI003417ECA1